MEHLSYSRLNCYLNCPLQFEYRYVDKVPEPISDALVLGSAVHDAIAWFFRTWLEKKNRPTAEQTTAFFISRWSSKEYLSSDNWNGEIVWARPDDEIFDLGLELVTLFVCRTTLRPILVEQEFKRELNGVPFVGRLDLIDTRGRIIDFKTKSSAWASAEYRQKALSHDLQPIAYAALLGGPAICEWHFLLKSKVPKYLVSRFEVTEAQLSWFCDVLVPSVWQAIQAGAFPPRPSKLCQYCNFREECKLPL